MTANDSIKDEVYPGFREFHIDAYLEQLHQADYSELTLGKNRRVLRAFSRWAQSKLVALEHLDESYVAAFVKSF
jgi:site-specific recombinase XerD